MFEFEIFAPVLVEGFLGTIILLMIFALNCEGVRSGFRLKPESSHEWLIYYFHLLESLTPFFAYVSFIGRGMYGSWSVPLFLGCFALLFVSSLVVWFWNRSLCYRELLFQLVLVLFAGFCFPAIAVTREVN